ncbi:replication factor C subunit 5, partial [Homo sapiens]
MLERSGVITAQCNLKHWGSSHSPASASEELGLLEPLATTNLLSIYGFAYSGHFMVEKYRPQTLNDLISHQDILSTIQKFINEDRLPHLLLYGPPGTGKTSTILACAKQLYKDKEFGSMVLELNASDDRGIDIIRGPILS